MSTDREHRLGAIVAELRALVEQTAADATANAKATADTAAALTPKELIDLIIGARQVRNRHLGSRLFGEPGWDILLGMYSEHMAGRAYSISAASTLGDTPPTTGLRWLDVLQQHGLVQKRPDEDDARRIFVDLTAAGVADMETYVRTFAEWIETRASLRRL